MSGKILGIAPYLLVDDVKASADWYRDKLGFRYERLWGDPPCFAMVKRNGVIIMLKEAIGIKGKVRPNHTVYEDACWDAYLWVEEVDALYEEFKAKGVNISRERCDQFYGNRDFDIEDCNGYILCFGQDITKK